VGPIPTDGTMLSVFSGDRESVLGRGLLKVWWGLRVPLALCWILEGQAASLQEGSIVRDVEIEEYLGFYLRPLARAAGFTTRDLRPFLVVSSQLNASATLHATILVHTGLILEAPSTEAFLGVLAHETGHIQCGHLARRTEAMAQAQHGTVAGFLAGALAGVATGRGDVGMSVAMGGAELARNRFMMYSQGEESAADQAAVDYCTRLGWPLEGLVDFLNLLHSRQRVDPGSSMKGILTTHPPTEDRIAHMRHAAEQQKQAGMPRLSPEYERHFRRMAAKLRGFVYAPESVIQGTRTASSFEDRYARAIALHRAGRTEESLRLLDVLLKAEPRNPFLYETKGQFLLEEGQVARAVPCYARAVALHPAPLLKVEYAQALLALEKDHALPEARQMLEAAMVAEQDTLLVWQELAVVYGRLGEKALFHLAMAEKALRSGQNKEVERHARKSADLARPGSREALRARDILAGLNARPNRKGTKEE
jgi:predicted Zn-dependent protease